MARPRGHPGRKRRRRRPDGGVLERRAPDPRVSHAPRPRAPAPRASRSPRTRAPDPALSAARPARARRNAGAAQAGRSDPAAPLRARGPPAPHGPATDPPGNSGRARPPQQDDRATLPSAAIEPAAPQLPGPQAEFPLRGRRPRAEDGPPPVGGCDLGSSSRGRECDPELGVGWWRQQRGVTEAGVETRTRPPSSPAPACRHPAPGHPAPRRGQREHLGSLRWPQQAVALPRQRQQSPLPGFTGLDKIVSPDSRDSGEVGKHQEMRAVWPQSGSSLAQPHCTVLPYSDSEDGLSQKAVFCDRLLSRCRRWSFSVVLTKRLLILAMI
ncbi:basic proline-rich protein-like [Perognathus longimembris pacificus]|uniref:basic proline-rich protein-like n=1 Tax=Perognathus longimembris pacificus TaxID=214514 RepID=UPI002018F835|nr:basic proline-rich protein-like [Perognathus longimembris pacificus]